MNNEVGNTHALRAVFALREKILNGELAAGTRLREVALAKELNISRTPVRDAMSRLAEEGLLERAQKGGFVIRRFGVDDIADSIELRGVLEGTAVRLAAERGVSDTKLTEIRQLLTRIDACFDLPNLNVELALYSELNAEFHAALSKFSASSVIQRELERVTQLPFASPSAFVGEMQDKTMFTLSLISAQEQHHNIVAAIAAREGARAEYIAREHARVAHKNLELILAENPQKLAGVARHI